MRAATAFARPRTTVALAVAVCASLAGCGRTTSLVPVEGQVMFADGQPVAAGTVAFLPRGGGPAARAAIDPEGRFLLRTGGHPGALVGAYDVLVLQVNVVEGVESHVHRGTSTTPPYRRVHPRHAQAGRSGLTATVVPAEPNNVVLTVEQAPHPR